MQRVLLLRMDEAAGALAVSKSHLERMVARGELRTVQIGRGRRVPASEVERWVGERMNQSDRDSGARAAGNAAT
jgi:excisionase family DNA binding protein